MGAQGRLPFQKKQITLESPTTYEKRILRYDSRTGEPVYYDPKPRVVPLDMKSGKYALRWIGYDGAQRTILYQRHDAIDAVVSASVSRTSSGQYLYVYTIKNLPSSGQHLSEFVLQTFASDSNPMTVGGAYVGKFSVNKEMKDGNWIGFGFTERGAALPGTSIELRLMSAAPPGLVECRIAGGLFGMIGVGEEPPQELENVLPIYEDWPKGYTIGPVDHLKPLSPTERAKYLLQRLPQFRQLGWMTADALRRYQQDLRRGNFDQAYRHAEQDLKTGKITTEVQDMIQSIGQ